MATVATEAGATPFVFSQGTDLPIPDLTSVQSVLNVPAGTCQSPLNDVNVGVQWNHTFNNDVRWRLRSPSGTIVNLMDDEGSNTDNGAVMWDDEAEALTENINTVQPLGWKVPEGALSALNGQDVTGDWALLIDDQVGGDSGTLTNWTLEFNCFDEDVDAQFSSTVLHAIPDLGTATATVEVPECDTLTDVDIEAVWQHGLTSDLRFEVQHGATTVVLWDSNTVDERGGWVVFDDESNVEAQTLDITNTNPGTAWPIGLGGTFDPDNPLSVFDGASGAGTWTLRVVDTAGADVGELQQFGVDPTCVPDEPPPGDPCDQPPVIEDGFADVGDANVHESNIDCIAFYGLAQGTGPGTYNPTGNVSRAQIATFVARLLRSAGVALPANPPDAFPGDDAGAPHELSINQLASVGVIGGNGETGNQYNPSVDMRRDHMASFLANAYEIVHGHALTAGPDAFTDDNGNPHEADINALAAAGVVNGTGPGSYNPSGTVTRGSMGSFLARTLQLIVTDGGTVTPLA